MCVCAFSYIYIPQCGSLETLQLHGAVDREEDCADYSAMAHSFFEHSGSEMSLSREGSSASLRSHDDCFGHDDRPRFTASDLTHTHTHSHTRTPDAVKSRSETPRWTGYSQGSHTTPTKEGRSGLHPDDASTISGESARTGGGHTDTPTVNATRRRLDAGNAGVTMEIIPPPSLLPIHVHSHHTFDAAPTPRSHHKLHAQSRHSHSTLHASSPTGPLPWRGGGLDSSFKRKAGSNIRNGSREGGGDVVGRPLYLDTEPCLMACEDWPQMTSLAFVLQERDKRFVRRCATSKNYALWRHKPEQVQLKNVAAAARRGIENVISLTPIFVSMLLLLHCFVQGKTFSNVSSTVTVHHQFSSELSFKNVIAYASVRQHTLGSKLSNIRF